MTSKLQLLASANAKVLQYFTEQFEQSEKAKAYVFSRISADTVKDFFVGYAPGNGLIDMMNAEGIEAETASELGLIGLNDDNTAYEVFTHRIMFPIIRAGLIVGFAGRTTKDNPTKYLNSKTSFLYNKKENLFGLWQNRQEIYRSKTAIIVEGYFDVAGLYDNGVENAVAACGTAFSVKHVLELKRYAEKAWTCYDGDEAGREAAKKTRKMLEKHGMFGGDIKLPDGLDPDEFVVKNGNEIFKNLKGE